MIKHISEFAEIVSIIMTMLTALGHVSALRETRFGRFCLAVGVNLTAVREALAGEKK